MNAQVEIILPKSQSILQSSLQKLIFLESFCYEVESIAIVDLLSPTFLENMIQGNNGELYAISMNTHIDREDTVIIMSGFLILSLLPETYSSLGLVGTPEELSLLPQKSGKRKKTKARKYRVVVDMTSSTWKEQKGYARTVHCLKQLPPMNMRMCRWKGDSIDTVTFPSSVHYKRCEMKAAVHKNTDVVVPTIPDKTSTSEKVGQSLHIQGLYNWCGAVACKIPSILQPRNVDTFECPFEPLQGVEKSTDDTEVVSIKWRGLLPPQFIAQVVEYTRAIIKEHNLPFAAIMVWGFADSPCSWKTRKNETGGHSFTLDGSNNYSILCFKDDDYYSIQEVNAHDCTT